MRVLYTLAVVPCLFMASCVTGVTGCVVDEYGSSICVDGDQNVTLELTERSLSQLNGSK